jgi:hypothetical protein
MSRSFLNSGTLIVIVSSWRAGSGSVILWYGYADPDIRIKTPQIRSTAYNRTRKPVDALCRKLTCEDSQEADCFHKRLIIHQKVHEHGACKNDQKSVSSCLKNANKRHKEGMVENA